QINLAWKDNGGTKDGFAVERSSNGTSFSQIATVGPIVNSYADVGLAAGIGYFYRGSALRGTSKSAYSNRAQAATPSPAAPVGAPTPSKLSATTVSSNQIMLLWSDSGGLKDGFKVERSLDGVAFNQIALVNGSLTTYLDANLAAGIKYSYRVR